MKTARLYHYNRLGDGHTYTYGDADWKDLLTAVDGQSITYDAMGNPTSYYNGTRWTFTWAQGRRLTTATDGTNSINYTYDADGLRTGKTVNGTEHTYYYAGGKLLRETYGDTVLDFFYDASGNAYALKYNGTLYYYITNLQGDVTSIVDAQGAVVASYNYDPYGNLISDEPAENTVGHLNPLRYRGYYYDSESELYYLQSRYYDPELGRFLNTDAFASTGQGVLGYNMFAYCGNNPINNEDPTGNYYTPTELHNFVLDEICDDDPNKTWHNTHMVYEIPYRKGKKFSVYGYCDLYDTVTHEIWDAKRFGGGITCTKQFAMAQVKNYVDNGTFTKQEPAVLKVGGSVSNIAPGSFIKQDRDGQGNYLLWYWDAGDGVIFYDYLYVPSGQEVLLVAAVVAIVVAIATGNVPAAATISTAVAVAG